MDAEPLVRGTGRSLAITAVRRRGRVASAVGGRRDPRPAVCAGGAYGDGRRPPPPGLAGGGVCPRGARTSALLACLLRGAEPPETPRCLWLALTAWLGSVEPCLALCALSALSALSA